MTKGLIDAGTVVLIQHLTIALRRRIPGEDPKGETVGDATVLLMADHWLKKNAHGIGER